MNHFYMNKNEYILEGSQVNSFGTLTNNKSNLLNRVYTGCSTKKVFQGGVTKVLSFWQLNKIMMIIFSILCDIILIGQWFKLLEQLLIDAKLAKNRVLNG